MQRFELIKKIGTGAYSQVFKAWDYATNTFVAIKQTNHTNPDTQVVLNRQIRILKKFNHPNIVKLLGCYSDNCFTYLILQYLPYDLITYYKELWKQRNRHLTDQEITRIFYQVCEAIGYMHNNFNIMHRDIKPENVLIDPQTFMVKIIDFGFAVEMNPYKKNTDYMVTRWYRPLQIVLGLPYDLKIDIFALGALLMELYMGQQIFKSASNIDQLYWIYQICGFPHWQPAIRKIKQLGINLNPSKQPMILNMTKKLRFQASNLIISMLQPVPNLRLNIQQVISHFYFYELSSQPKKRIISQQKNTHQPEVNSHNLSLNLQKISEINYKNPVILSDRATNAPQMSNSCKYDPPRRKSEISHNIRPAPHEILRLSNHYQPNMIYPTRQPHQLQYPQDPQSLKQLQYPKSLQNSQHQQKKKNNYPQQRKVNQVQAYEKNLNTNEKNKGRESRIRSLRIEVTSSKKLPPHEYYTPKYQDQHQEEKKQIPAIGSQKKFVPLKLKPSHLNKKNPTFSKIRSKILESNVKVGPKTKISLSNRLQLVNSYDQRLLEGHRNHLGLQVYK